jgi:hypothetical protein
MCRCQQLSQTSLCLLISFSNMKQHAAFSSY